MSTNSDISVWSRNAFLGSGILTYAASRFCYKRSWMVPFQALVILSTPLLGVAVMQTVRLNYEPGVQPVPEPFASETERRQAARQALSDLAGGTTTPAGTAAGVGRQG